MAFATRPATTLPTRAAAIRKTTAAALVEAVEGGGTGRAGGQRRCGMARRRCGAEETLGGRGEGSASVRAHDGTERTARGGTDAGGCAKIAGQVGGRAGVKL